MKLKKSLFAICIFSCTAITAQQAGFNVLEKDYDISRKAKKGYLGGIEGKDNGTFDMIYFLPSSKKKSLWKDNTEEYKSGALHQNHETHL